MESGRLNSTVLEQGPGKHVLRRSQSLHVGSGEGFQHSTRVPGQVCAAEVASSDTKGPDRTGPSRLSYQSIVLDTLTSSLAAIEA